MCTFCIKAAEAVCFDCISGHRDKNWELAGSFRTYDFVLGLFQFGFGVLKSLLMVGNFCRERIDRVFFSLVSFCSLSAYSRDATRTNHSF